MGFNVLKVSTLQHLNSGTLLSERTVLPAQRMSSECYIYSHGDNNKVRAIITRSCSLKPDTY